MAAPRRPAHRPARFEGEYPYRLHRGAGRFPRTPLIGDFAGDEEDETGSFGYREIPKIYPTELGEERFDSIDAAVTPTNIAIGSAVVLIGIVALAYFTNKNNLQSQAEHKNIL